MLRLVCLGDSLTGPQTGTRYLDKYVKWSDLLQLILETHLGPGRVKVLNRGVAGNSSSQALARLETDVLSAKPDIAIVLIGGNNFGNSADPHVIAGQLRDDLTTIVDQVKAIGSKIVLLQYPDPRADDMSKVWTHINAGNPVVAEVARAENVPALELATVFREAASERPQAELTNPVDGIHLNPYGEVVLARTVFFALRDLGWI